MTTLVRLVLLAAVAAAVLTPVGRRARARAAASRLTQVRMMMLGMLGMGAGGLLALWMPQRLGMNPGSPAPIVVYVLCWVIGGVLGLAGLAWFVGAALAKPGFPPP